MELAAGTAVDRFVVEGLVGRGGMASVYRIRHRSLNVAYALKVMHVTHPELADRIRSEGALQAELRHPNIVTVFDMIEVGGLPALVMEYVDGPSMAAMLDVHQPTLDQVDELVRGMLKGVRAAHGAGLIHRDLKPANVLLAHADDGYLPKITDFGLAKSLDGSAAAVQTRTGVVMGTPAYMAPEQFRNTRAVDARADIYSLGVVMYELCAGRRPYDEEDLFDLLDRVRNADYPRVTELVPSIPDRMADAIEGAMAVDPDGRLSTVEEVYEVWCGNARMDRSRVWNRAVLQQIGQSLSESQSGDMEIPGARPPSGRKSGPQRAAPPTPASTSAPPTPSPVVATDAPPAPLATLGPDAGPPPLHAALVQPPPREASSANDTPATLADVGPVPADDDDGPVHDGTMFEPIRRAMPISPAASVTSSDDPAGDERAPAASEPGEERPTTEWVGEEEDRAHQAARAAAAPSPTPTPVPPPPPTPPAALAQASILVQSAPPDRVPVQASMPAPLQPPGSPAQGARPKVSLTDSTPSLHLPPPPTPPPVAEGRGRTAVAGVTGIAALLMVVLLVAGAGLLVVAGGTLIYALAPGGDESPLPVIEVRDGEQPVDGDPDAGVPDADPDAGEDGVAEAPDAGEDGVGEAPGGEDGADPGPDEVTPAPTPSPAPGPRPKPVPKPAKGRVVLTGDATSIRLVGGGKSYGAGSVPVGDYELRATFPGQGELPQRATVQVRKGQTVTVNCVAGFYSCSIK